VAAMVAEPSSGARSGRAGIDRVAVIGAGSWGTTVASLLAHNVTTALWARRPEVAAEINEAHVNSRYLSVMPLHPSLRASASIDEVVTGADVVVMGVPSHGFRSTLVEVAPYTRAGVPVVSLAKGLEQGTNLRMTEVVAQVLPGHPAGVLTGPNLSKEILSGHAAAAVIAMVDESIAEALQQVFGVEHYRVYTNTDVIGCEIAGALKNVVALAAGIAAGLGTGDNTLATLITRGLSELTRLGVAMGGRPDTFSGLAGLGDLVATCISTQSRNRYVGVQLAAGRRLDDIVAEMQQVAEGVKSVPVVRELGRRYGVEMPITEGMYEVVVHGRPAVDAYRELMRRKVGREVRPA
jgi:glycerol-3-phosphate dehydrogenase (NAD(P)+)